MPEPLSPMRKLLASPHLAPSVFIALLTSLLYSSIADHKALYWDDLKFVFDNSYLQEFSWTNLLKLLTDFDNYIWHPVTSLSLAFNFYLTGANPLWFKITNIAFHVANSILIYFLAYRIFIAINARKNITLSFRGSNNIFPGIAAFITATIFSVHTQHVESVIWIIERKDLLCAFFYFSALLAYLRYLESENTTWKNTTLVLFILALLSKPMAITFPAVLILIDLFIFNNGKPVSKETILSSVKSKLMLIGCSLFFGLLSAFTQRGTIAELDDFSLFQNTINATTGVLHYLYTIIDPRLLSPYYPHAEFVTTPSLLSYLVIAIAILATVIIIRLYFHGYTLVVAAVLVFLVTLFPVSGILKFGHAAYADRYTYIPLVSIYMLISYSLVSLYCKYRNNWARHLLPLTFMAYLTALGLNTYNYTKIWANDTLLWNHVTGLYPYKSHAAYVNLGNIYFRENNVESAFMHYRYAHAVKPDNMQALQNIARLHDLNGNQKLASHYYHQLAQIHSSSPSANIIAGDYFYNIRNYPAADRYYKTALEADPGNVTALLKHTMMDFIALRHNDALKKIKLLLAINPDDIQALKILVKIRLHEKNYEETVAVSNLILEIDPQDEFANYIRKTYGAESSS